MLNTVARTVRFLDKVKIKVTFDMSEEVAEKSLDLVFKSPSKFLKIEFQGGEPLLNFELIKKIVFSSEKQGESSKQKHSFCLIVLILH